MGKNNDDYYDWYYDDTPFEDYKVESRDPDWKFLLATFGFVAFFCLIGSSLLLRKLRREKRFGTKNFREKIQRRYDESLPSASRKNFELLDLEHSKFDLFKSRKKFNFEKVSYRNVFYRRRIRPSSKNKMRRDSASQTSSQVSPSFFKNPLPFFSSSTPDLSKSRKELESPTSSLHVHEHEQDNEHEEKAINRDAMYILQSKHNILTEQPEMPIIKDEYRQLEDKEEIETLKVKNNKEELNAALKDMFNLAIPWTFSAFVESSASIVTVALISHYMGTAEMISYSYVWFILDAGHIVSNALYSSLYKHTSNCVGLGTEEAYYNAGKYIKICVVINAIFSIPVCVGLYFSMGSILQWFGYGAKIVAISQNYTIIAIVSQIAICSNMYVTIVPDLEGHAGFDAMYGLFDSLIDIAVAFYAIPFLEPTLFELGLIHLGKDTVSYFVYYLMTWTWKGWYDNFKYGFWSRIKPVGDDRKLIKSLLKKVAPLTFDAITAELEWFLLTFFAAYLGSAEAATWILISHIWGFVSILPDNIASAAEYKVAALLSSNDPFLAKRVASTTIWIACLASAFGVGLLMLFRDIIVDGMTQDAVLEGMLSEIIPYCVCDPILSVSTVTSCLNRGLALYRRTTKIEFLVTIIVTLPVAVVSTYVFGYNIEGLTAAMYVGYTVMGFFNMLAFMNADWDKAVMKNKMMSGVTDPTGVEDDEKEGAQEFFFDNPVEGSGGQLELSTIFIGSTQDDDSNGHSNSSSMLNSTK